jgi:anthranilate phosphoribosyltransferase
MIDPLTLALEKLIVREDLTSSEAHAAVLELMSGGCPETRIAAFLTALRVKGEQESEIAGAARAMRERATRIPTQMTGLLDTCGTGGSRLDTFNISTATAIVAAACGIPVAKHGNRGATSTSGSSDVLEALGVNLTLNAEQVGACLDEIGICFCYAPLLHLAMKHVGPVRKSLGFRTIFNLLGPLSNPAGAEFQLLGTVNDELARKLAGAVCQLGTTSATIVCGANQLDEVSLWGETLALRVRDQSITEERWTARSFGLPECRVEEIRINSPAQSADWIRRMLVGEEGPPRNLVLANAAAALLTVGKVATLTEGVATAARAIDTGAAKDKLQELITLSQKLASTDTSDN